MSSPVAETATSPEQCRVLPMKKEFTFDTMDIDTSSSLSSKQTSTKKHVFDPILSTPLHQSIGQSNMSVNAPYEDEEAHQHQEQNLIVDFNDYPEILRIPSNHVPLSHQSLSEKKVMSFVQKRHQDLSNEHFVRHRSQGSGSTSSGKKRSPDVFRYPEDSFSSSSRLVTPLVIRACHSEPCTMVYERRLKMRRASGSSTSITNALFINNNNNDDPFSSHAPLPKLVPFSPSEYSPSKEEDGQRDFVDNVSGQVVHPSNILFPRLD
eukprot:scaffold25925_cov59-Attheya_sp.AAC.3